MCFLTPSHPAKTLWLHGVLLDHYIANECFANLSKMCAISSKEQ